MSSLTIAMSALGLSVVASFLLVRIMPVSA